MTTTTETLPQEKPNRWAPPFFTIWTGEAFSQIGTMVSQFAIVWWFAKTTESATVLAFSSFAGLVPPVLVGPFAGVLVDRWNRRAVMIIANMLVALSTLVLVGLFASNAIQVWHIYTILFLRSVCNTFHGTALNASTSLMVPQAQLTRVAGLNQTLYAILNIASPPFGALLVAGLAMPVILLIDVAAVSVAVATLCFVGVPQPDRAQSTANQVATIWTDLKEGFRYVIAWKGLFYFCLIAAAFNFLAAPLSSLMPLLVTKDFHGEAMELGFMTSAFGLGMLAGAVILSVWGGFKRKIVTTLVSVIGIGIAVIILGFSPMVSFTLALGAVVLIGVLFPIANGPVNAVLQTIVAPEVQGRVFNLVGSLSGIAMPLGLICAGPLADLVSLPVVYMASGILFILVGAGGFAIPALMHIEEAVEAASS